jgi:hypothetical protein
MSDFFSSYLQLLPQVSCKDIIMHIRGQSMAHTCSRHESLGPAVLHGGQAEEQEEEL